MASNADDKGNNKPTHKRRMSGSFTFGSNTSDDFAKLLATHFGGEYTLRGWKTLDWPNAGFGMSLNLNSPKLKVWVPSVYTVSICIVFYSLCRS